MSTAKVIGGPSGKIRTLPTSTRGNADSGESSGGKKKWIALVALLLLIGIAWLLWPRDTMAARVAALRSQMDAEGLSRDQRRELMNNADPEVREAMWEARQREWDARERKWLREFFAMSHDEQIAAIDKSIDRMQRWRKEREDRASKSANNNNNQRGNGNANNNGNNGRGGPGGNGGNRDPITRRDNYLSRTTAEQRAQNNAYRQMVQQRMQQRGISGGGGRGGFGGRGG